MAIERNTDSNSARIINCAVGVLADDEDEFVEKANAVANFLSPGLKVLAHIDDTATVWTRTTVPAPVGDATAEGPLFVKGSDILTADYFNSIVIVGAYIFSQESPPKTAWVRAVGMAVVDPNPTFGLIKIDED